MLPPSRSGFLGSPDKLLLKLLWYLTKIKMILKSPRAAHIDECTPRNDSAIVVLIEVARVITRLLASIYKQFGFCWDVTSALPWAPIDFPFSCWAQNDFVRLITMERWRTFVSNRFLLFFRRARARSERRNRWSSPQPIQSARMTIASRYRRTSRFKPK